MPGMTSRSGAWINVRSVVVCDIVEHLLQREDRYVWTPLMVPGAVRARHALSMSSDAPQDFLLGATASAQGAALSSVNHMRYKCARIAFPILAPSSTRRIGIERGGG